MIKAEHPRIICFAVAVYQNAGSLKGLLDEIDAFAKNIGPAWDYRIVFIDDGSTDTSFTIASELARENSRITVVRLSRNFGQLYAMIAAFDHAVGDVIVSVSADQQDPISVCKDMITKFEEGCDVIIAHRMGRDDRLSTRITSALAYGFLRLSTPNLPQGGFDYFMLSKRAMDVIRAQSSRNRFFPTDVLSLGFKQGFVSYHRQARKHGKSQYNFFKRLHSLTCAVVDSSYLPIRLASAMGMVIVFLGMVYGLIVVIGWMFGLVPFEGWAVLVILNLVLGGMTIFTLGIIGEYVWRIYDEVRGKPLYIVDRIVSGNEVIEVDQTARQSGKVKT